MTGRRVTLILALVVVAAACGDDVAEETTTTTTTTTLATTTTQPDETTTSDPATTTTEPEPTRPDPPYLEATVSAHGVILTDDEGMTVYLFMADQQGASTCTGTCATTWPPLIGDHGAGPGVDEALIGTVARADGSMQVTYNDWPLYHYAGDQAPGDTTGQGFNGVWWVVSPEGEPLQ